MRRSDFYHYRARYYDTSVGRFASEDPLRFGAGDDNFYRYVYNVPNLLTDPFGLEVQRCQRPVKVAPKFPHDFLYSTEAKEGWGLGPSGGWAIVSPLGCVPGKIEKDEPYDGNGKLKPNYSCNKVSDNSCVERCLIRKAGEHTKKPPKYCLGKYQCQHWADDILDQCQKECTK
jgi:uncharacterized protein RhaS with RHS repeats